MSSVEVELLLDRLLSASAPSDCIDSLEQLQKQCRIQKSNVGQSEGDPKEKRPSQLEAIEEERQRLAIDTILASSAALNALCSLIAQSTLPSQHDSSSKMEVEGGDVAACELLLQVLPSNNTTNVTELKSSGATTTEQLQAQRQLKRRTESIAKKLLHFHEIDDTKNNAMNESSSLALIPSLLDCLCASSIQATTTTYARVLSLQILQSFLSASPGALREQLMKAPDGINRLVDLLGHGSNTATATTDEESAVPEEVRNEAILFLTSLASSSSVLARLITFSEGYDRALKIALGSRGSGLSIAMDCLELCLALAHADEVSRELFLGGGDGRGNLDRLGQLVDLRRGERFRSNEKNLWWENELKRKEEKSTKMDNAVENKSDKKSGAGKGSKRGKQRKDDDLDDLLRGAGATTTSSSSTVKEDAPQLKSDKAIENDGPPTPYLTPSETAIADGVFNLVLVLLYDGEYSKSEVSQTLSLSDASRSKRRSRAKSIVSHDILCRSIVDCALYTLPPPGVDYVSAVPTPDLQQKALATMAVLGSVGDTVDRIRSGEDEELRMKEVTEETAVQTQLLFETMPLYLYGRVTAMDRLMYLCCTGAYTPKPGGKDDDDNSPEAIASNLSINALSTFYSCLPPETASRMVLHALAPPPPEEADETGAPLDLPVVTKLVTTLAENLRFLETLQQDEAELDMAQICRASIGAAGSAGALGVFLTKGDGDTNREMLLRLPPPPVYDSEVSEQSEAPNLIDFILQHVARYEVPSKSDIAISNTKLHASNAYVTASLLKLLCEWVFEMPKAVSQVLSSPSSVSLGLLIRSNKSSHDKNDGSTAIPTMAEPLPALSGLLLGLCLEYMVDIQPAYANTEENAAWTRETIMSLIQSIGVGKYLTLMDGWKTKPLPMPYCRGEKRSPIESRSFQIWYNSNITLIRRRVVMTLAGSGDDNDSDSETEDASTETKGARSLKKMIKSQVQQIEELQAKLEESLVTISTQTTQINDLKRITEIGTSAETNDVMSEYAEKVSELEKEKLELVNESKRVEKLHEEVLAAKENEIEEFKEGLRQSEASLSEMKQERDTLSEEVDGLSSAYNLLENEYRNSSSAGQSEMTAGGETPAENGDQMASVDQRVKALQEENSRLSADVRAANDWMAMAVSRMDELEAENESLRSRSESTASDVALSGELDSLRQELDRMRQESETFKLGSENALAEKDDELARSQALVHELEAKIEQLPVTRENSLQTTVDQLKEQNASLSAERDGLQSNLDEFQQWAATAQSRISEIEAELGNVSEERDALNDRVQELESSANVTEHMPEGNESEIANLKDQVAALTLERDNLRSQLSETSSRSEEPKSVTDEIQAMIDKLQEQNASLSAERDGLQGNLDEFQQWAATAQSRISEIEAELGNVSEERDALNDRVQELESSADADFKSEGMASEIANLKDQVAALTLQRDNLCSQLSETSSKSEEPKSVNEATKAMIDKLQEQNASLSAVRDGLLSNVEFQQWAATAQSRISEIEEERDALNDRVQELESSAKATALKLKGDESERANLKDQVAVLTLERDNLRSQLSETSSRSEELKSVTEETHAMIDKLQEQNASLSAERDGLQGNLDEFQQWAATAQSRISEIEAELSSVTSQRDGAQASLEEMKAMQTNDSFVIEQSEELLSKDEEISNLRTQLERAQGQLNGDLESERQRIVDLSEKDEKSQALLNELRAEKEELLRTLAMKQTEIDSNSPIDDSTEPLLSEAKRRIADLEEASKIATNEIIAITAERKELQSKLDDAVERYEQATKSAEDMKMEVDNFAARNRALEQDNKSLEQQFLEATDKCKHATELENELTEKDGLLAEAYNDLKALQNDGHVQQWKERTEELERQLELQEQEATDVISQWEARYLSLETDGKVVIQEWEKRAQALEADVSSLEMQVAEKESEATQAISQWEARCSSLEDDGRGVVQQWKERTEELERQLELQEQEATEAISQWEARYSSLEADGKVVIQEWEKRAQALEADVSSLEMQVAEKESEATQAISQWEARCSSLEDDGRGVVQQWEVRAQELEADIQSLEMQLEEKDSEATEAISQWEARCSDLESSLKLKDDENAILENQGSSQATEIQRLKELLEERDGTILSYSEQVKELADEIVETREQSEQVVQQWQERSDQLETNITELEETIAEQKSSATEAIAQWEERCSALHEQIQGLELQLQDTTRADDLDNALTNSNRELERNKSELSSIKSELEAAVSLKDELQKRCVETTELLAIKEDESKQFDLLQVEISRLKSECTALGSDKSKLEHEKHDADKENNNSKALIFELQEELRSAQDDLQSAVTDQFSAKATEIATHALRQEMAEIRRQYSVDQEALALEKDARAAAEDEVIRLKSDLALLAEATEYDDDADLHVRKVAKKIAAENVLKERKEMEELRSALDRLKEELGSCRWREREAEEKATNARLQMSILEQEVSAARADITLMEQALDELENVKIELTVSHEYRIETLENERISVGNKYEEEINVLKAELAQTQQEKDSLAHKLDQSERANTALVYSTTHDGVSGEECESEVVRLQLERAQLLAKVNELGTNVERRVSEAVAAHAANAETELIMEKQRRNSVETNLSDALSKINEMKAEMSSSPKAYDDELSSYKRMLDNARFKNDELREEIKSLQSEIAAATNSSTSLVSDLTDKLKRTEERLRSVEREGRFEDAMAAEIANLRAGSQSTSNGSEKKSFVLRGLDQNVCADGNGSTAHNSAYIIEMYDYVVELKQSIEEERRMYKELVTEHEDLLALLGQTGLDERLYAGE